MFNDQLINLIYWTKCFWFRDKSVTSLWNWNPDATLLVSHFPVDRFRTKSFFTSDWCGNEEKPAATWSQTGWNGSKPVKPQSDQWGGSVWIYIVNLKTSYCFNSERQFKGLNSKLHGGKTSWCVQVHLENGRINVQLLDKTCFKDKL